MSKPRETEILLGLLEAVEAGGQQSQRHLASELGIALGLVNIYLKRCIRKGLIKVAQAPARRYAYYLTPQGFSEKSRLTAEYLSWSLKLYRRARSACEASLAEAHARGWRRIAIVGHGDLAEVMAMCAAERDMEIMRIGAAGITSAPNSLARPRHSGAHVPEHVPEHVPVSSLADAAVLADGAIITDLYRGTQDFAEVALAFGSHRVLVPSLVTLRPGGTDTKPGQARTVDVVPEVLPEVGP